MARAGAGNYWFVESDDQMAGIFEGEIEGLVALAAQNVEIEVRLTHPKVAGVSFLQSFPVTQTADGWKVALHDLYATSPKALALVFHVEDVRELGKVQLGEIRVEADVVHAAGIEHRTTVMPVVANLDGEDRIEPTVEQTFLRFQAARAREEAVRRADNGDFDTAAACLRDAAVALSRLPRRARRRRGDRGPARGGGEAGRAPLRRGRPQVSGRPGDGGARAQGELRPAGEPAAAAEVGGTSAVTPRWHLGGVPAHAAPGRHHPPCHSTTYWDRDLCAQLGVSPC